MGKSKQAKQVLLLAALLGGLLIVVVYQFYGGKKTAAPAAPQTDATAASATPAATTEKEGVVDLSWVEAQFMPMIVDNVARGRDPFHDSLMPADTTEVTNPAPAPVKMPGADRPLPVFPTSVLPSGPAIPAAVATPVMPVMPPVPPFVLCGVIATPSEKMTTIRIDDRYYTLLEGEVIPNLGWRVVRIQANAVILGNVRDAKEEVLIKFSGGESK